MKFLEKLISAGWTQAGIAEFAGMRQTAISKLLNGAQELTLENAKALAKAFNCSLETVVYGEDFEPPASARKRYKRKHSDCKNAEGIA
jgi:transcriptional regulator with XRE-family HTH domain